MDPPINISEESPNANIKPQLLLEDIKNGEERLIVIDEFKNSVEDHWVYYHSGFSNAEITRILKEELENREKIIIEKPVLNSVQDDMLPYTFYFGPYSYVSIIKTRGQTDWHRYAAGLKYDNTWLEVNQIYINQKDDTGYTALHLAASWTNKNALIYLLESGAHPLLTENTGQLPLDFAFAAGDDEIISILLRACVNFRGIPRIGVSVRKIPLEPLDLDQNQLQSLFSYIEQENRSLHRFIDKSQNTTELVLKEKDTQITQLEEQNKIFKEKLEKQNNVIAELLNFLKMGVNTIESHRINPEIQTPEQFKEDAKCNSSSSLKKRKYEDVDTNISEQQTSKVLKVEKCYVVNN